MSNFGNSRFSSFGSDLRQSSSLPPTSDQVFFLDPANRAFLDHQEAYPKFIGNMAGRSGCSGSGCTVLIALGAIVITALIIWQMIGPSVLPAVLNAYGDRATATITDAFEEYDVYGNLSGHGIAYFYQAESQTGSDQNLVRIREDIPADLWKTLSKGQTIAIHYLRIDPYLTHTDAAAIPPLNVTNQVIVPIAILAAIMFFFIGIAILANRASRRRRNNIRQVLPEIQVVRGQVISSSAHTDSDDDLILTLQYRYYSPIVGSNSATGSVNKLRNDLKERPLPAPGTPLAVVVFPKPVSISGYAMVFDQRYEFVL